MNACVSLLEDCAKQWEVLLLLLSAEEKKVIRNKESEINTINYFLKNQGIRKILLQWLKQMHASYAQKSTETDTAVKSDNISFFWRQKGNEKFKCNSIEESYRCYNKSIVYANQNGLMYSLALANRSAALLRLKKFQECLSDIDLAIKYGYPEEQQHKLLLRRVDCYIELGEKSKAQEALSAAINYAKSLCLSTGHYAEFERHMKVLENKLDALKQNRESNEENKLPDCYMGENPNFNAASSAIELRHSEEAGRYVATREATHRGDVLFSEKPYAWVALPSDVPTCENCCQPDINLVPCSECSRSVYCSEECRKNAQESFHMWECVGAQSNIYSTVGIAHLALRVLLMSAHRGFPEVPVGVPIPDTAADLLASYSCVDPIEIYKKETPNFYRMFNLVTNFDKMNNCDYIQYAITATMLTIYLEEFTSFFEDLPSAVPYSLAEDELYFFTGALVLRALGQLVCNGHATLSLSVVEEDDGRNGRTVTEREVRRATAIYPSAAMMNHSCDPNIINTFHKNRLIIRCSRELPSGSEVFNCYGPHRAREPAAHRRAQLRAQYMFTCNCAACTDVEHMDFVLLFSAYACQSCKGPGIWRGRRAVCQQCRSEVNIHRARATLERADELLAQAEQMDTSEKKCEKVQSAFRLKQQVWHKYHTSLRADADRLARLYADIGEFTKSVELIKQNIQSLEYQFGSFSVEVANELRKLSDVMLERILSSRQHSDYKDWCLEAHKIIKKAIQLTELNYGAWTALVKRLKEQEAFLATLLADNRTSNSVDCVHQNFHYNLKI